MAFDQSGEPKIREARDSDAAQISGLYRQAYTPAHSGDARKSYPFPQFLVAEEVAEIIRKEEILWIVADLRGRVVGTVGAVHNIAGEKDCVAEAFGLVVDKEFRVRRVATNMVKALWELLNQDTCFILVEARTAHQGGWRILRGCGFAPIGLEPFAHSTPAGSEAMLLTARIAKTALKKRIMDFKTTPAVKSLSNLVLSPLGLEPPLAERQSETSGDTFSWSYVKSRLSPVSTKLARRFIDELRYEETFRIEEHDSGDKIQIDSEISGAHTSGTIYLRRLQGRDPEGARYRETTFWGRAGEQTLCCLSLLWDRIDCRAQILEVRTLLHGLQGLLISKVLNDIEAELDGAPLTLVINVRADYLELQAMLESLSFFPTAYYPGFIETSRGRVDVVQYTRLCNLDIANCMKASDQLSWTSANDIALNVCNHESSR